METEKRNIFCIFCHLASPHLGSRARLGGESINTGESHWSTGQTPRNMQTVSRLLLLLLAGGSMMVGEVAATCQCLDDNCVAELGDVVVPAEGQTKHGGKFVLKEQKYYCSVLNDGSCPDAVFSGGKAISYKACESYVPPPANARPDKQWKTGLCDELSIMDCPTWSVQHFHLLIDS